MKDLIELGNKIRRLNRGSDQPEKFEIIFSGKKLPDFHGKLIGLRVGTLKNQKDTKAKKRERYRSLFEKYKFTVDYLFKGF